MYLKENLRDFIRTSFRDSVEDFNEFIEGLFGVSQSEIPERIQRDLENISEPSEIDRDALELFAYRNAVREYNPDVEHLHYIIEQAKERRINPALAIAIVTKESSFRHNASRRNRDGSNDYGYFQLNSRWHNQHRSNIEKHIEAGLDHLRWCLDTERNNVAKALSRYNSGRPDTPWGMRYARRVLTRKRRIQNDVRRIQVVQQRHLNNLA